ncbi:LysE family translocator [Mangrovitalea sediminis]|uniref:LysE family translocator n=1 Tax=Mangrovitalea sediminis TaxID=1982043 RepID=UPI000BE52A09|nr:LysE family translocator [Mangrovitalea sediminis]
MLWSAWLSVAAICVLGAMSPGPSLAMVLRHTLHGSRLHGVVTGVMHGLGVGLYALLVVAGLAALILHVPWLFHAITWLGALYLAWIAFKSLRSSGAGPLSERTDVAAVSLVDAARDGFLTACLNPKVAVFFLALFSQFVSPGQNEASRAIMAATAWLIDTGWYVLVALVLSHSAVLPWLRAHAQWVDRVTGLVLFVVAVRVVTL